MTTAFFSSKLSPVIFRRSFTSSAPTTNTGYNTAGIQARAFSAGGDPFGGSENYISWTRFDEYGYANYLRSEFQGSVAQINPGNSPNTDYWLRMDRVRGSNFNFYEKSTKTGSWQLMTFPSPVSGSVLRRADFAGQPLQVGIIHATFNGQIGVQFTDFSLSVSNAGTVAAPSPPSWLVLAPNSNLGLDLSWSKGTNSVGSVVVAWAGTNTLVKEMPANGFSYSGNATYGQGDPLPATGYYVVYAGTDRNVSVTGLAANTTYNVAVFSYAGSGSSISYNHFPVVGCIVIPPNPIWAQLQLQSGNIAIAFTANPGKWYWLQYSDALNPATWQNLLPDPVLA